MKRRAVKESVLSALLGLSASLGVHLRSYSAHVRYCGSFYGQTSTGDPLPEAISVEGLIRLVEQLPSGVTELGCHPGQTAGLASSYLAERER